MRPERRARNAFRHAGELIGLGCWRAGIADIDVADDAIFPTSANSSFAVSIKSIGEFPLRILAASRSRVLDIRCRPLRFAGAQGIQ